MAIKSATNTRETDQVSKSRKNVLEVLPDQLHENEPYSVPDDIKSDRGDLFAYICAICYGPDHLQLTSFFRVSRQTFWNWRGHGGGLPNKYRKAVGNLIASDQEPYRQFRMPTNATLDDIMRPRQERPAKLPHAQNHALLDLLTRITASHEYGYITLPTIIGQISRPVSSPHIFYYWAWGKGGVPRSYVAAFITALMELNVYKVYGYAEGDKVQWKGWAEKNLAAPHDADGAEDDE